MKKYSLIYRKRTILHKVDLDTIKLYLALKELSYFAMVSRDQEWFLNDVEILEHDLETNASKCYSGSEVIRLLWLE